MATKTQPPISPAHSQGKSSGSIEDDFMYGSNVAQCHVYVRMGFLRKVYGILTTQLLITTLTGALFVTSETVKGYVQQNHWMLLVAMLGTIVILIPLMIKRQETPTNYILLGAFTLMEAYTVGVIVTFYDKSVVVEALALTLAVTFGLTVYTLQSKRDFSSWGAGLFAVLWILIFAGFFQMIFPSVMMDKMIAVGGAFVFSLFIIFDTHMMMRKLSPEEYVVAAVNLYLDIINLFLYILRILQESRR